MQAVIFDIDGTLLHSSSIDGELYDSALRTVLGPVRLRPSRGAHTHVTDDGILNEVLLDNGLNATSSIVAEVERMFFDSLWAHLSRNGPIPEVRGAKHFVEELRRCGIRIAYATGGWGVSARMKLQSAEFPLSGFPLVTSDDSEVRVDIMRIALKRLGDGFEKVTYYGDGEWDRAAARELRWEYEAVGENLGGISEYIAGVA